MSAPDMPGLKASDGHQATPAPPATENAPQGLDDAALGGPDAWAAVVADLAGEGPTPPPCQPPTRLSGVEARLDEFGWQVRPCSTGGWFTWSESGTAFCRELADLRAVARRAKHDAKVAGKIESHAASMEHSIGRMTPTGKASPRWDRAPKPVKADRPAVGRDDFFTALGRVLARTTARRGEGNAS